MCKVKPKPLVVELIGGAGVGKSSLTYGLMFALKINGIEAEYMSEVAKKLSWEKNYHELAFQPKVTATQMFDLYTLCQDHHELDVIVTDTSFLLGLVYCGEWGDDVPFRNWVTSMHNRFDFLTYNIQRNPVIPYDPHGRNQTEDEAKEADLYVEYVLEQNRVRHTKIMNEGVPTIMTIFGQIMERVNAKRPETAIDANWLAQRTAKMLQQIVDCTKDGVNG